MKKSNRPNTGNKCAPFSSPASSESRNDYYRSLTLASANPDERRNAGFGGTRKLSAVVALGGGGARGLAHLGAIDHLRTLPLQIDGYVGVSIGALASALCAVEPDTQQIETRVVEYLTSEAFQLKQAALFSAAPDENEPAISGLFAWYHQIWRFLGARKRLAALFSKPALLEPDVMQDIVDALIPDIDISETATPISIVALDLLSGREVVLTHGSLKSAVMASAAIPGVFPPVPMGEMLLVDVGMIDAIPARIAKSLGADLTIAVDVGATVNPVETCATAAEIFLRLSDIGESLVRDYTREIADIVIRPKVADRAWYDFSDPTSLIELGRQAAVENLALSERFLPTASANDS